MVLSFPHLEGLRAAVVNSSHAAGDCSAVGTAKPVIEEGEEEEEGSTAVRAALALALAWPVELSILN